MDAEDEKKDIPEEKVVCSFLEEATERYYNGKISARYYEYICAKDSGYNLGNPLECAAYYRDLAEAMMPSDAEIEKMMEYFDAFLSTSSEDESE